MNTTRKTADTTDDVSVGPNTMMKIGMIAIRGIAFAPTMNGRRTRLAMSYALRISPASPPITLPITVPKIVASIVSASRCQIVWV